MNLAPIILGSFPLLINLYANFYPQQDLERTLIELQNDASLPRIRTYDFIIVGGGAAGCILAARLSANYRVLLLEAGGNPVPLTQSFVYLTEAQFNHRINYNFYSVAQMQVNQEKGGISFEATGRMLGGSTSHNGLTYNRGHPLDFDEWARETNDSSWSYNKVLKYFRRIENYTGRTDPESPPGQHGHDGPMNIETPITPLISTWFRAGSELGYNTRMDSNGPQMESFAAISLTRRHGRRVSAYTAYLRPAERAQARRLRVERYSEVETILIKDKCAYGVLYRRHGIPQIAHARNEVIVSCGAFGSPLLLMRSGIGPAKQLKQAGITPLVDLPVGMGLKDQPAIILNFTVNGSGNADLTPLTGGITEGMLQQFFERGEGPITLPFEINQTFIVSSRVKREGQKHWPDLRLIVVPVQTDVYNSTIKLSLFITLARPTTTGFVKLNTTAYKAGLRDDESLALIDFNMLTDPTDRSVMLEGIKLAIKILEETVAFQELGTRVEDPKPKACATLTPRSDPYWLCILQQLAGPAFHITSSCRMGSGPEDTGAVLDSRYNVLGMRGLKVVDSSAMPVAAVNANPVATFYMMAEKAAAQISASWKRKIRQL